MSDLLALPNVPDRGDRCNGCAFTPGTEANESPLTLIKAVLSAKLCEPFYCHRNLVDGKIPEGRGILCAGWDEMVQALNKRGYYKERLEAQAPLLSALLSAVLKLEDRLLVGESIDDFSVLAEVLTLLDAEQADDLRAHMAFPAAPA